MNDPDPSPRLLLLDKPGLFPGLRERLVDHGYEVSPAGPEEALRIVSSEPPSMVIVVGAPEGPSADVLAGVRRLREKDAFVPVIVLLAENEASLRVRLLREGADECLDGSIDDEELVARLEALLRIKGIQDRMHRSRRQLQRLSTIDALTGVLNRRHFEDRVREELRRAKRYKDFLSLLVLEIDGFRAVSEEHGEEAASEVLRAFARLITEAVRDVDLAGRLSGDTFVLLLPQTHLSGALTVAERVVASLAQSPFHVKGISIPATASIGVAFFPSRDVGTQEDLLRLAREALYQARREGPGRVGLFQGAHYVYRQGEAVEGELEDEPETG